MQLLGECNDEVTPLGDDEDINVFGWQFRPVLGAKYVQSGERQVFAQLALPTGLNQSYAPHVYMQVRWRSYNADRQVVGAVFKDSCNVFPVTDGITLQNPLKVHDVSITDMGAGVLKVHADGEFFSASISAVSGATAVPVLTGDGSNIDVFINAAQLMQAGYINLVQEDGRQVPLAINAKDFPHFSCDCGIKVSSVDATPLPDGTSRVHLEITYGATYDTAEDKDGFPHPLVLIGGQVYGVQGSPFVQAPEVIEWCPKKGGSIVCTIDFVAGTDALRAAQTFTVRDLRWKGFESSGTIQFEPAFSAIKSLAPPPVPGAKPDTTDPKVYAVTGFGFDRIIRIGKPKGGDSTATDCVKINTDTGADTGSITASSSATVDSSSSAGCLEIYDGLNPLAETSFSHDSPTTALVTTTETLKTSTLRLLWHVDDKRKVEWDMAIPKSNAGSSKITSTPALLGVGDSRLVSFSGGDDLPNLVSVNSVSFEQSTLLTPKPDASSGASIGVIVTTSVTQKPGYKELTASVNVKDPRTGAVTSKSIQLPLQVIQSATPFN